MALTAASVLILAHAKGKTRASFLIGDHRPDELTNEDSDREGIFCSVLLDEAGHALLPHLEKAALERAIAMLEERRRAVESVAKAIPAQRT